MRRWPAIMLAVAGGLALLVTLRFVMPMGYDFYHWYWPIPRAWLAGETHLYDAASSGFYYAPWAVWLLLPFSLMELPWGMAALTLASIFTVLAVAGHGARAVGARWPGLCAALVVLCPYALQVWFVGTHDAVGVAGVYLAFLALRSGRPLAFGAALLLAAVRPQHAFIVGPVLVLLALRQWRGRDLVLAAAAPFAMLVVSAVVFGLDWPWRLVRHIIEEPPGSYIGAPQPFLVTSTYDVFRLAGIPWFIGAGTLAVFAVLMVLRVWRLGVTRTGLDLLLVTNAIVSPHFHSQSYVVLLALPWVSLAVRKPLWSGALYLMSFPLLLRAGGLWDRLGLLDVTFPLLLAVALLLTGAREPHEEHIQRGREQHEPAGVRQQH